MLTADRVARYRISPSVLFTEVFIPYAACVQVSLTYVL
jgi:hypothetical protein